MIQLKIVPAIFIIAAGLVGSYFIIKNSGSEIKLIDEFKNLEEKTMVLPGGESPIQFQWLSESKQLKDETQEEKNKKIINSGKTNLNFTKLAAQSMFIGMRQMEEENKSPFDYFNPSDPYNKNNKKAIEAVINNLQNSLSLLEISVNDNELNISSDNSYAAKIFYLESARKVIADNSYYNEFLNNPLKAFEKLMYGDASAINKAIESYAEIYKSFLNISVPSEWLELHKRYIAALKKTEIIYRGMADFQNDPVKAALFGEKLPEIIKEEAAIIKEYDDKEKEMGI